MTDIESIARRLSPAEVAEILSRADEPQLFLEQDSPAPAYPPEMIAAARIASARLMALSVFMSGTVH